MPTLEDDGFVLWESNAILFYMAAKRPDCNLWPSDSKAQADVVRWLAWESAHWDAESCGMVAYEKAPKPCWPRFSRSRLCSRGRAKLRPFCHRSRSWLRGKTWLLGERLTIADFSVGGLVPSAERLGLPVGKFPEILRWYNGLAALPTGLRALEAKDASVAACARGGAVGTICRPRRCRPTAHCCVFTGVYRVSSRSSACWSTRRAAARRCSA